MTTRENVGLIVVGVLGCTLLLQRCNRPTTVKGPAQLTYQDGGNVIDIKHKDKNGKVIDQKIYEPDPGSTVVTTDKNGNVTVKVRQFGVGFEPGLGIGYSDTLRVALDARVVYFKRASIHTGIGMATDPKMYSLKSNLLDIVDPYVGVGYVPWLRFANTSLVASYTATKHAFVFVRFRF